MSRHRVCVVGSGTHFISGISYYTVFLSRRLAEDHDVSVILMRALIPKALYPGRERVGAPITKLTTSDVAPTFDGIDWTMVPSVPLAIKFLYAQSPEIVLFQWWTAAALPAYLALTHAAKRRGAKVILEMHEDLHSSEATVPVLGKVARAALGRLLSQMDAFLVHSAHDEAEFASTLGLPADRVHVVPLGPFEAPGSENVKPRSRALGDPITILFFGTIRPYKGLEDLVDAFDQLPRDDDEQWRLLVVGESWENWTLPIKKIASSRHRSDIELVNRYVSDEEVPRYFERADLVALPYLHSSASGPLHLTMAMGLPVVVTNVGGLASAVESYPGAVLVPPSSPQRLATGITEAVSLLGEVHSDPHSWDASAATYSSIFDLVTGVKPG